MIVTGGRVGGDHAHRRGDTTVGNGLLVAAMTVDRRTEAGATETRGTVTGSLCNIKCVQESVYKFTYYSFDFNCHNIGKVIVK